MITVEELTKRYGGTVAIDRASFRVEPGRVTGFLGPNGAGKSTTLRVLLGLDHPTSGRALVDGLPYRAHREPMRVIGSHLESRAFHPGRSARQHLLSLARTNGIRTARVDQCLEMVGIARVGRRRSAGFSLGMGQRLGIAAALLGDPRAVVLDEPANGLDSDGVHWIRGLLRDLAAEGRTVLITSHLLAEVQQSASHVVVMGRGAVLADCPIDDFVAGPPRSVVLRTPDADPLGRLRTVLPQARLETDPSAPGVVRVFGASAAQVGDAAHASGVRVHHLAAERVTLEAAYRRVTGQDVEYAAASRPSPTRGI